MVIFETKRLYLRLFVADDLGDLYSLTSDPDKLLVGENKRDENLVGFWRKK